MSRVGKKPIPIPANTKIGYKEGQIRVEGQKGVLSMTVPPLVDLHIEDDAIRVTALKADKKSVAMQGLARSLVANMVIGVSQGFERKLEINGIGYRSEVSGNTIVFHLGYSHPINFNIPEGIDVVVEKNNVLKLSGIDKELLGHTAAAIRRLRPPEPYKGKGVKYAEEYVQRKAGKTGTK
jgi:large subunit ribosomal protein L6